MCSRVWKGKGVAHDGLNRCDQRGRELDMDVASMLKEITGQNMSILDVPLSGKWWMLRADLGPGLFLLCFTF